MTATIDHTCFPGIIDNIIHHAPTSSLLVLRAASKAFRHRIDRCLFNHALMHMWGSENGTEQSALRFQSWAPYTWRDFKTIPPSIRSSRAIDTLDIMMQHGRWAASLPSGTELFRYVTTVRRFGEAALLSTRPYRQLTPFDTVVDFLHCPMFNRPWGVCPSPISGTRRHICHVEWIEGTPQYQVHFPLESCLQQLVLVLWPRVSPAVQLSPQPIALGVWKLLGRVMANFMGRTIDCSVVVVGFESTAEYTSSTGRTKQQALPSPTVIKQYIMGRFAAHYPQLSPPPNLWSKVTFLTHAEWHRTLSNRDKKIVAGRPRDVQAAICRAVWPELNARPST